MAVIGGSTASVAPDPVLTALAVELGVGGEYVADRIAPVATVQRDEFKYATWGREEVKDDVRAKRAMGTGANEVQFSKTFTTGAVENYALKEKIPDEIRNNDPDPAGLDRRAVKVLVGKLRLGNEKRVAAQLTAAAKTQTAPSVKWDAASGVTIRKDILNAREAFRRNAGMYPNVVVVPPAVSTVVFNDATIVDLIKHTSGNLIAEGMIERFLNMDVLVPGMIKDTSNPGVSTPSIADIYASDEVYYLYVDPNAGNNLQAMTALRQVRSLATSAQPFSVLRWRDPDASAYSDMISVACNQIELTIAPELVLRHLDVLT